MNTVTINPIMETLPLYYIERNIFIWKMFVEKWKKAIVDGVKIPGLDRYYLAKIEETELTIKAIEKILHNQEKFRLGKK